MNKPRVWFHRSRSIAWIVVAALAPIMGWLDKVELIAWASLYANIASDWSASEAADDSEVRRTLRLIMDRQRVCRLGTSRTRLGHRPRPGHRSHVDGRPQWIERGSGSRADQDR